MHQSASISQRYVGMKTMVFVTFRWGNSAKRLGTDAPLMHFSPQRDVVMHCRPQRDVVMHTLSCNNSGCIKLNSDIWGVVKTRNAGISRNMPEYHGICRNITVYAGICRNITEYAGISRNITTFSRNIPGHHDIFRW